MPDLIQLRTDIGAQVDKLYKSASRVIYNSAVHEIATQLNTGYQSVWQSQNRGKSFRNEVAKLLVAEMYERVYRLNPEYLHPRTNEVIVPSVKRNSGVSFRKPLQFRN